MNEDRIGIIVHGIGEPKRPLEPGEASYWISEDQFLRLLEKIVALPNPDRIRLSFDDGNASDYQIALPALMARGLTADFFILTGRIGQSGSMSAEEIISLQSSGMMIGSHGIAHVNWTTLSPMALQIELEVSRAKLSDLCGAPPETAAIPFGAWNGRVLDALRRAGYRAAHSSDGGSMSQTAFLRPRASVRCDLDDAALTRLCDGQLGLGRRLRRAAKLFLGPLT